MHSSTASTTRSQGLALLPAAAGLGALALILWLIGHRPGVVNGADLAAALLLLAAIWLGAGAIALIRTGHHKTEAAPGDLSRSPSGPAPVRASRPVQTPPLGETSASGRAA